MNVVSDRKNNNNIENNIEKYYWIFSHSVQLDGEGEEARRGMNMYTRGGEKMERRKTFNGNGILQINWMNKNLCVY